MKISQIVESATTAGSIATVESPLGTTQSRTQKPPKSPKVIKGRKFANTISEGKMKEIAYDLQHMDAGNFKKKYGKTKEEVKASLKEEKIAEADLIVVPGMRKSKDKSFIPHKEDRRDHEVEMARSDLYAAAKDAMRIFKLLKDRSEDEGIMGWQQSYITLASDYLNSVADSLEYQMNMYEMTGGVIAGGMSNFEEGMAEGSVVSLKDNPATLKRLAKQWWNGNEQQHVHAQQMLEKMGWDIYEDDDNIILSKDDQEHILPMDDLQGVAEGADLDAQAMDIATKLTTGKNLEKLRGMVHDSTVYSALDRYFAKHNIPETIYNRVAYIVFQKINQQGVNEISDFKRKELEWELRNEPKNNYQVNIDGKSWKVFASKEQAEKAARTIERKYNKKATVHLTGASPTNEAKAHKCPECGGELISEEMINEKKDACYYKVKSRYKVWPSAYASGALVKCRKKGASNWGNKSKK
jgi:hypothetical protein